MASSTPAPGGLAAAVAATVAALRKLLSLPAKPSAAEQRAEDAPAVAAAARREAADEIIRARSRKVMRETRPGRQAPKTEA